MAGGSACMLVVAVNPAKQKPDGISGKVRCQKKPRMPEQQQAPQSEDQKDFRCQPPGQTEPPSSGRMVSEMPFAPEGLWNTQQNAQEQRKSHIQSAESKKRPVNKIVGDGIGVPPQPQGNDWGVGK